MDRQTLLITAANRIDTMARITGLLSSRGFDIESVMAAPAERSDVLDIHLVTSAPRAKILQLAKQIRRLIDIIRVVNIPHEDSTIHEFLLLKVRARKNRSEIFDLIRDFGARAVAVTPSAINIDLSGPAHRIERFLDRMRSFGIRACIRSGPIAVVDGRPELECRRCPCGRLRPPWRTAAAFGERRPWTRARTSGSPPSIPPADDGR